MKKEPTEDGNGNLGPSVRLSTSALIREDSELELLL